ncbi:nucleotidyltransferase family protein [Streptomyces hygroscopicus]|uniref:nucleotidyltransferase family protein n=1 Tax=Streptomyces hygroscopicus TaxID=1912 RepID=UPI003411857C
MRLKEALLRGQGREEFDELDSFLLGTVGGRAPGFPAAGPDALYERAEHRRVAHLLHSRAGREASGGIEVNRRFSRVMFDHNLRTWEEIAGAFADAGIRVAGVKGLFLGALLRRTADQARVTTDLDLLVDGRSLDAAMEVLASLGFVSGLDIKDHAFLRMSSRAIRELEAQQGSYGQVAPMARLLKLPEMDPVAEDIGRWLPGRKLVRTSAGVRSLSVVDLHFDMGHRDASGARHAIPAGELLDSAVTVRHGGTDVRTLDHATMTWLLCYRAYCDIALFGERRLKLFADITDLIRRGGWPSGAVEAAVARYPFIARPIEETLRFLREECAVDPGAWRDPGPRQNPGSRRDSVVQRDPAPPPATPATPATPDTPVTVRGTVLVCHGWGSEPGSSPWVGRLSGRLARRGMAVVELAPFAAAGDVPGLSEVAETLRERVEVARKDTGGAPVGLIGVSLGSAAALAAVAGGAAVDFLVTVGTVASADVGVTADGGPRELLARYGGGAGDDERVPFLTGQVRLGFLRDLVACVGGTDLGAVTSPVLVLSGGTDNEWRLRDAATVAAHAEARGDGSARRDFPAGNHTLDNAAVGTASAVLSWLTALGVLG